MSRLDNFLITEAKFTKTDLPKVVKVLVKVVERAAGTKFSPMGGVGNNTEKFRKSNGNVGVGMRYVTDDGLMVRFNLYTNQKTGMISSVDIFTLDGDLNRPEFTLVLPSQINSIEMAKSIGKFVKNPRKGPVKLVEGYQMKRIELLSEVKRTPENLSLADTYNIDIDLPAAEFKKKVFAVVTAMAQTGVKEVSELSDAVDVAQKRLDSQTFADPEVVFADLDDLVGMVASGYQPSLLVTGMAGIGKTYNVTNRVKGILGSEGEKWKHIKGKLSPVGMYQTFFLNRDKLIIFDDADSVFANQDTVNMLKAALDSYDTRTISWISPTTVDVSKMEPGDLMSFFQEIENDLMTDPTGKIKFPNAFEFTGRVIFISNIHQSKIDSAVKSRSFVIDITLKAADVFKRMESILEYIGGDSSMADKHEVLDYLKENVAAMADKEVNMRTFILAMRIKNSGTSRWKDMVVRYT